IIDGIGLNLTGLSYNGTLWVCFVSCRKMLPDPAAFVKCLAESFDELVSAAVGKNDSPVEVRPAAKRLRRTGLALGAAEKAVAEPRGGKKTPATTSATKRTIRKSGASPHVTGK
ncbi:MAG TPA: WS/DGAT domain-containing protein, partial [Azonexus sp.]